MDGKNNLDFFEILKHVKKEENFKLALMSRDEKIAYIVKQMEDIEANAPSMVEYCEPPTNSDFLQ